MKRDCHIINTQGKMLKNKQVPQMRMPLKRIIFMLSSPNVIKRAHRIWLPICYSNFPFNVYSLLDPGATLSFVTPLVAMKFYILPSILDDPFLVLTQVGDSVVVNRVYKRFTISWPNRVTLV